MPDPYSVPRPALNYVLRHHTEWPGVKNKKFLQGVIQTVYNYASNAREQYLLLKLLRKALATEIAEKVDSPKEFITGNPYVIKLTINQYREHTGTSYLADALAPLVTRMLDSEEQDLNTNPVDIYKRWINKQETETGAKSDLPYEVSHRAAHTMSSRLVGFLLPCSLPTSPQVPLVAGRLCVCVCGFCVCSLCICGLCVPHSCARCLHACRRA